MRKLIIHKLYCRKTEDLVGKDDVRIEISPDGNLSDTIEFRMDDGQTYNIDKEYKYNSKILINIFEFDMYDPDDHMLDVALFTRLVSYGTIQFNHHRADYTLTYSVVEVKEATALVPRTLTIEKIYCHKTEDYVGKDSLRLYVTVDGNLRDVRVNRLNDGQSWNIYTDYSFTNYANLELWEIDYADPNDYLGAVRVGRDPVNSVSAKYRYARANYTIWYTVK